jgi:hypothetical protein
MTQIGKYKKEKNQTKLKWDFVVDDDRIPSRDIMRFNDHEEGNDRLVVQQEISLEGLKNSTI